MKKKEIGLGTGIFLPADISLILGINSQKVNNWLKNYWGDKINYIDNIKAVNFHTLIEIYIFNTFLENGISRKKVKSFYKNLSEKFKFDFPFAHNNFYFSKNEIYTFDKTENIFDTSFNYIIEEFIIPFTEKIEYSNITNVALKFFPLGKDINIVIDPQIQFGKPTINGTRITTDVITEMLKNNFDVKDIANWYELDEKTVNNIANFYNVA